MKPISPPPRMPPKQYGRAVSFSGSPHHWILLITSMLLTLALAAESGRLFLGAMLGLTLYILGRVLIPTTEFYKRWAQRESGLSEETRAFLTKRDELLGTLAMSRRNRYTELAQIGAEIEAASSSGAEDYRLRSLEELLFMFMRLLATEQSLEAFLLPEREEKSLEEAARLEQELATLAQEIERLRAAGHSAEAKERVLTSRKDRHELLKQRAERVREAESNLEVVQAELDRLEEQFKLLRAEAMAAQNGDALSTQIGATLTHLQETSRWLSRFDHTPALADDVPLPDQRVGFEPPTRAGTRRTLPPRPQAGH